MGRAPARLLLLALVLSGATSAAPGCGRSSSELGRVLAPYKDITSVGDAECARCHEPIDKFVKSSVHRENPGCETCHGHGDKHTDAIAAQFIVGPAEMRKLSPRGRVELCTSCHTRHATTWGDSDHARAGLTCAQCHTDAAHWKQEGAVKPPSSFPRKQDFCVQCHASTIAEFRQPHRHPALNGGNGGNGGDGGDGEVPCSSCHSPHGERVAKGPGLSSVLRGNETCAQCHARQAGPKVFRHAALDEGCTSCHTPHASPFRGMLRQPGNGLCLGCHFQPGFPVIAGVDHRAHLARGAACVDCHVEIHGSNSDPSLLRGMR